MSLEGRTGEEREEKGRGSGGVDQVELTPHGTSEQVECAREQIELVKALVRQATGGNFFRLRYETNS